MLPLAPFEKLLPDTPLGWNDYHRAVDDWWRGPAAAFASSALPPGPSQEHEHALTHIALHVRRFPLRPRTPPLEDQGEIHVGGMPLVERWMREGWIRLTAGANDQAVRWYRDVRDTARSDAGLKKLVKLMNDYRGSRKEVLDAAVSAWASESPARVSQPPPVYHPSQVHHHHVDGPLKEPCQPGPSRSSSSRLPLPQPSSSRSHSSRPPLSPPPVSRPSSSPPPSRSANHRYAQEPLARSPSRHDQDGSTKTTPDVPSRVTESSPDQDDHPTSELRVVPVLRLRLPPADVQAEIIELRRQLGEETARREQAESKLGEGTIRREQAERKLGEETTRKEQAERSLTEEKDGRRSIEVKLGEETTRRERAERRLGEETKRREQAEKRLGEETTRKEQAEKRLGIETDARRSVEEKLGEEVKRVAGAERKFHQERLAGLKDLIAMSPGAQSRKDLSTLTRMELEARLAKSAEAKSADGKWKSRAEVVEFLDLLVESVRRGDSVPVGKRWSRQMIPVVLKSILKLAETDGE